MGQNIKNQKELYRAQNALLVTTRVKILLTFLVSLVLSILSLYIAQEQYMSSLVTRVETMSSLLDPAKVASLKQNDADAKKNESILKSQLQKAISINSDARSFYVLGISNTNTVYYLVDSETKGTEFYARRGTAYRNASEALKSAFFSDQTVVERREYIDRGTNISVIAPVHDSFGTQIGVVGMDLKPATYYSVLAVAALIPVVGAVLVSAVFLATDTIRRRRQESLRLRSELVSIASHELRTPLTGIRWGEESLLKKELMHESKDTLESMYDSTIRLQESIEDILQLANWQAGRKQEILRTSADISVMLQGIFATQKLPAAQKNVSLELAKEWPKSLLINCDVQRMKRVLNNLLSNAIKYATPGTAVTVSYQHVDGKHLISIHDRGIGIPKKEQERVFEGFYRASNAVNQEASGTGMGLYMSRQAIEQHGGKLWLKSEEGKGTTVFIQLP